MLIWAVHMIADINSFVNRLKRDCKTGLLNRKQVMSRLIRRRKVVVAFWNQVMVSVIWAQGNRAEDCEDMSHNANVEEELLDMEDDFNEQNEEFSPTTNVQSEETSSASSKKRKRIDPFIEGISNAAALLGKELREASTTLSQSLNTEVELQKKTSMVTAEILKIPSMNQSDKFKASRKIMREPEAVLTFWNLEGEDRETFVKLMLEESTI
ncbi:hypothetical protein LXL04_016359 [Taraxacum kok-saghyz]